MIRNVPYLCHIMISTLHDLQEAHSDLQPAPSNIAVIHRHACLPNLIIRLTHGRVRSTPIVSVCHHVSSRPKTTQIPHTWSMLSLTNTSECSVILSPPTPSPSLSPLLVHAWFLRLRTGSDFAPARLPSPDPVLHGSAPVRKGAVADARLGLA